MVLAWKFPWEGLIPGGGRGLPSDFIKKTIRFSLSIFKWFRVDLPSQTMPEIIQKTTFCTFGRRSFPRMNFGGILDDLGMHKPWKYIVKHSVFKLFRLLEKLQKSTSKMIQNYLKNYWNTWKTPFRNHVFCFSMFLSFLLDFGSILGFILASFWTYFPSIICPFSI